MKKTATVETADELTWAYLVHLGFNMWSDRNCPEWGHPEFVAKPDLRFDDSLWNDMLQAMVKAGINMLAIDLGDGVKYQSCPEIAAKGAWSCKRLVKELDKVRSLGIEPVPKLNFSASHDTWMGEYSRCLSTPRYYRFCGKLIAEVEDLFDKPRFFHIGMDEETARHQRWYAYAVMRQHELWWHDFNFLVDEVEKGGSRAWMWSDYIWEHKEEFFTKMRKSVLHSNWYYGQSFSTKIGYVKGYLDLESRNYQQMPGGSNWDHAENFGKTVSFCRRHIAPRNLMGFLMTVWKPTIEACRDRHMQAIELVRRARSKVR